MQSLADSPPSLDLLEQPILVGDAVAFTYEGRLALGLVRYISKLGTCRVDTYWTRRGRLHGPVAAQADMTDCVVVPHSRLRRGNEIHERLIQESSQCQT